MIRNLAVAVAAGFLVCSLPADLAGARTRHRSGAAPDTTATEAQARRSPAFYPQEVVGGVSGNLPFNNQIRKHTDPLNANGAR